MTPQEYYGSPAPGVGGPSGGAQVLGNMATQEGIANRQIFASALGAAADREVQKRGQDVQLEQTRIQAEAQVKSAELGAGATKEASTKAGDANPHEHSRQNHNEGDGYLAKGSGDAATPYTPPSSQVLSS